MGQCLEKNRTPPPHGLLHVAIKVQEAWDAVCVYEDYFEYFRRLDRDTCEHPRALREAYLCRDAFGRAIYRMVLHGTLQLYSLPLHETLDLNGSLCFRGMDVVVGVVSVCTDATMEVDIGGVHIHTLHLKSRDHSVILGSSFLPVVGLTFEEVHFRLLRGDPSGIHFTHAILNNEDRMILATTRAMCFPVGDDGSAHLRVDLGMGSLLKGPCTLPHLVTTSWRSMVRRKRR